MPSFSVEELTAPLTREDFEASLYRVVEAQGTTTTAWQPGAVFRTLIAGLAIMLAAMSTWSSQVARAPYLDYATRWWLTLTARYVFGVTRRSATFATGNLTLVNEGAGIFAFEPGDCVARNPVTGALYRNLVSFELGIGESITTGFAAVEAGAAGTSLLGTITAFESSVSDVAVTNPAAFVGLDEQTDPELRAACRAKLGALSPSGPSGAYAYAAINAVRQDGTAIGVTRTRSVPDGYGGLTTYVATSSGAVTGDAEDPATDLGAIAAACEAQAATLSVAHTAASASEVSTDVSYQLWAWADIDPSAFEGATVTDQIKDAVALALAEHFAAGPIGGASADVDNKVFVDSLQTAIGQTFPAVYRVKVTAPADDVAIPANAVATLGTVTGVVSIVRRTT